MRKKRYIIWSILVLILTVIGVILKMAFKKDMDKSKRDIEETIVNKTGDNTGSVANRIGKKYSLWQDKKFEKELLIEQHDKLIDKVNLKDVLQDLKSEKEQVRLNAVKTLKYFPEINSIPLIQKLLLNDNSAEVRGQCAVTLQLLNSKGSIPSLILALNDHDRNVKIFVLALAALDEKEKCFAIVDSLWDSGKPDAPYYSCHIAFRDLATPSAISKLVYDLDNTDKFVAIDAAIILAQLNHSKEAFPLLEQSLSNNDKYIRIAALRGLAYIGDQSSIKLIKSKIDDPNKLVRDRASFIFKNIENNE